MNTKIIWTLIIVLLLSNAYLLFKMHSVEYKISGIAAVMATFDTKMPHWDKAVEILEDCLEYNTLGECKQVYPQYDFQ